MNQERKSKTKPKTSSTVSKLQSALGQSVILPKEALAKGRLLQMAISRSIILPKERYVACESVERPSTTGKETGKKRWVSTG